MSKIPGLENLTILSESDYCILYRGMSSADNTPVICKALKSPPPHNYLLPRFHNEFELWRKIESDGVLKVYGWHHTDGVSAFLVEDFDGLPLSEISDLESYPLETQLQMALQLTKALGDIHKHNVVFTNLALHNILYDSITRQVKIADFSRARQLPVSHLQPSIPLSHRSLPYISPEQTGRTNRSQDHRSDFYSLGICLYRIITGTLPFTAVDPVEYIHHHVAQPAPFAHQAYDGIPKMLSKIIHKLMEKSAESRYQSTKGILHDLKLCLSSLQELGTVPSFQLGKEDISEIFQLPERLYGRDKETAIILENLNSIIGSKGKILFISGVSGIGKSSLVNSLKGPAASQAGYFLSGKFDQAPSEVPYSPILSALSDFISQILAEGEHSADRLKRRVLKALGNRGSIITQVIPEAEFLLGEQPPLPPLSAKENEQRFSTTLSAFIQACCSRNSPLILFLDDMQWADSGTLSFIEKYLLKLPASGIFILGTFRSNEVADSHPLHLAISKIRQKKIPLPILHLQPLTHEDVTALVADALYTTPEKVYQLAEICLKKTGGNPFFVRQFLTKAHHLKNIWYSPADGEWLWNERDVSIMDSTDNLLPLQKRQLAALKEDQLKILKFAACLGNSFDLKTLQAVTGEPEEKIVKTLHQVSGIINGIATPAAIIGPNSGIPHSPKFAFSHDRLQRAAYSLLTSEEITTTHYLIGTRLLALGDDSNEFARVLGITGHLNIGADMIHDEREKYSLAKMNLKAGKKAMISAASHSALNFFHAGLRLLPAEAWLKEYELTFSLHSCCAEAAYMSKNYGLTNQLFSAAMANCNNLLEKTRLYSTKIKALKAQNKSSEAVQCGREILAQFDIHLSHKPSKLKALLAFLRIRRLLAGLKTADIKQLPPVSNPHISAVLSLLTDIGTATYYTSSSLLPEIALKAIELALKHGHSIDSALMGFTTYGFLECGLPFGRIETGYSYGMISLEMYGKGAPQSHPQIPYLVHNLISHWKYPVSMTAAEMEKIYINCMETGDFEIASNALYSCTYRHLICGTPLAHAKKQADEHEELIERLGHQIPLYRHRIFQQTLDNLLSEKKNTTKWEGRHYSKKQFLGLHQAAQDTTTLFLLNFVQLLHHFTFSDYLTAHHFSQRAEMHLGSVTSSLFVPILTFYSVLTRLQLCRSYSGAQKIFKIGNVLTGIKKLKKWAYHCPQNYLHKYHLALAELNSVIGKNNKALSFYDLAIKGAKKNDYPQDRAIAQELIASHLSRLNHTELAALNLQESYISYLQWGASAKAIQMKKRHPQLAAFSRKAEVNTGINLEQTIPAQAIPDIDISAMIKATKLMNGSIIEDELQTNILTTLLENAGAQKGYLIFENNGEWTVTLCGYLEESGVNIEVHPPNRARPSLSLNIVQYVARTNESVVLGRPLTEGLFTQDSYIQKNKPQSIMCLPLVYKEKISGIVYLENNLASEAFSKKRQDIIFSICTQAAVSLKNSSLYSELEKTVEKLHLEIKKRKSTQLQLLQAEKLAALGRLSASIAHEFGNPMIGIQYLLQDILTRFSMSLEDEKLIEVGIEECQRMKILIRDMQQLNRPSSGRKRQFDPHKAIQNVLLFQKKNLSNHKIRVVRKLAKNIRPIMAVEDQITQVLVNITLNAVDAMTENGGTLTISTHQDSDFLDIVVRDTGCGIALNDQKNIFEPFFSTKPNVDGTGLGLPISYSIVKNHDGDILFSSTPAEGSTFHIKLPCNIAN